MISVLPQYICKSLLKIVYVMERFINVFTLLSKKLQSFLSNLQINKYRKYNQVNSSFFHLC